MKRLTRILLDGLVKDNPLLMLMIGLCSALAVTTSTANGIGMGLAMTFVLLMSEVVISLFRKLIPDSIRMPIFNGVHRTTRCPARPNTSSRRPVWGS